MPRTVRVTGASGEGPWNLAAKLLAPTRGQLILEIAAGGGYFAQSLLESGAKVIATDLNNRWQADGIPFLLNDFDAGLPFQDESFDSVVMVEALNFVESVPGMFREALRVLKPGGVFVATFPNCLCLESRFRFLLNGTYRWFPHHVYHEGSKAEHSDLGRDPVRITTAVFTGQRVGFELQSVEYGSSKIGLTGFTVGPILVGLAKLHNRIRKNKNKATPDFACSLNSIRYRNVGFRMRKPS